MLTNEKINFAPRTQIECTVSRIRFTNLSPRCIRRGTRPCERRVHLPTLLYRRSQYFFNGKKGVKARHLRLADTLQQHLTSRLSNEGDRACNLHSMDLRRFSDSPIGRLVPVRGIDGRFGIPYEHVAYVADPLADEPALSAETWRAVNAANRALARLDQASSQVMNPRLLRRPTLRREAQSTSALEGTFAPLEQVIAAESTTAGNSKELVEVLNYVEAADIAFGRVADGGAITSGLLESSQGILVKGTDAETEDAGRVRRTLVAIGSPSGALEDSRFVPQPPGIELRAALDDLTTWIGQSNADHEPLVAAAMAHYQFETLHPFNDGNGRVGRLLIVLHFMVSGLLREPLLSVSPWFEARKLEYQELLAEVSATAAWDAWISFFARGIEASADDTAQRVDRMLEVQKRYVLRVQEAGLKGVVRDILDILIGQPIVTASMLAKHLAKSAPTINAALDKLVGLGILDGPYGNYSRRFVAPDVWAVVNAPVGKVPPRDAPLLIDVP